MISSGIKPRAFEAECPPRQKWRGTFIWKGFVGSALGMFLAFVLLFQKLVNKKGLTRAEYAWLLSEETLTPASLDSRVRQQKSAT